MLPLNLADVGAPQTIMRIGGSPEVKRHLENLGFVVGGEITVLSAMGDDLIVRVKETRVGIGSDMAKKIMV